MVNVELITVGDELLIGQVVDTNSAWMGSELGQAGARVVRITSLPDHSEAIREGVTAALARADVVIMTGGLGPTKDDITKHTLAELFGTELIRDTDVFEHIRQMNAARGIPFNELNQAQALVPEGITTVLENRLGTAPGMMFRIDNQEEGRPNRRSNPKRTEKPRNETVETEPEPENGIKLLFALPGVPFEMKELLLEQVIPLIHTHFFLDAAVHRTVVLFGLAESALALRIAAWEEALPDWLHLAYLPNARGIRLRLSAYEVDAVKAGAEIDRRFALLKPLIDPYLLGDEPASVEFALAALLVEQGATLAVAESCTGGAISSRITALAGASAYYRGGITAYSNDLKIELLGVSSNAIEEHGAVSREVAEQMALGALERLGADYAIATTGVAGPTGGTPQKPIGTVWMAVAYREPSGPKVRARCMRLGELREENIARASTHALNLLRLHLLGHPEAFQQTGML